MPLKIGIFSGTLVEVLLKIYISGRTIKKVPLKIDIFRRIL
jgi:hypothetical protein